MKTKKIIRKLHLWLGLVAGIIIFIVAITGCIYAFKEEITEYSQQEFNVVNRQNSERIPLSVAIDSFKNKHPDIKILFIKQKENKQNSTIIIGNKENQFAYNPYNGQEVKHLRFEDDFFSIVLEIHRNLFLGEVGKKIIGIVAFVFFFMIISGLIIWFPTNLQNIKSWFLISSKSSKRLIFDFHRIGGFYASLVLIFIVSTGLFFSYEFVKKSTYTIINSEPYTKWGPDSEKKQSTETDIALVYSQIQKKHPNCIESTIYYPKEKEGSIRIKLKYDYDFVPKYNTFFVDKFSGKIIRTDLNQNSTPAETLKNAIYGIHTGGIFGIAGKTIVFIATLVGASLPITGFIIWRKKQKQAYKIKTKSG